jgi:hypothetical protein
MATRLRTLVLTAAVALSTVVLLGTPAGAQQLVDAGKEQQGGLAFVLMAVMFGVIFAVLFSMDRIRKRRLEADDMENQ